MKKKKVAVAMSGGVDSGVAAALVVKEGYQAAGFQMSLWSEKTKDKRFENKCCSTESLEVARKTAHQLGMPFHVLDYEEVFKKKVVDYFLESYTSGLTPNPCVRCNHLIKFGQLLDYVRKLGYDFLATGHYARINKRGEEYQLTRSKDENKDQTYFLFNLRQREMKRVLFPVGVY